MSSWTMGRTQGRSSGTGFKEFDEAFPWWNSLTWSWEVNIDNDVQPVFDDWGSCVGHMVGDKRRVDIKIDMPGATEEQYKAVMDWLLTMTGYYGMKETKPTGYLPNAPKMIR